MRNITSCLLIFFFAASAHSQEVIGGAGSYGENNGYSLAWTLGETVIETASDPDNSTYLTQGFHQGSFVITYVGEKDEPELDVNIYPNPVAEQLTIDIRGDYAQDLEYEIYDLSGKSVFSGRLSDPTNRVNMNRLANAQYILLIKSQSTQFKETYKLQKIK